MAQLLEWDKTGEHVFETGVDHCVLYDTIVTDESTKDDYYATNGVAWSGITGVNENPSGADFTKLYADNIKYLNLQSAEEFGATIEAYTYPDEWAECDGSANYGTQKGVMLGQQKRKMFGLCYRTKVGNDSEGQDAGYKLHLIYGCQAAVSGRQYQTVNESPSAITFSWEIQTTPVNVPKITGSDVEYNATSIITIDSTRFTSDQAKDNLADLEAILYGTKGTTSADDVPAKLPTPAKVMAILNATS